jgi:UDP-N-acetylmuramate dehydrogenase
MGCIFKNPAGQSAGELIEKTGLKNLRVGGAIVSPEHANFIINLGEADSQDIYYLIGLVQRRFKDKTGIELETELRFLGEFDENTW